MQSHDLVMGVFAVALGLSGLLYPGRRRRVWERRREELSAGAPERFFEERRALEAYPPGTDRRARLAGLGMVLAGMVVAGLALSR